VTCRVLGFSTQTFYAWTSNPISQRDWDDAHVTNAAIDIHHDDPAFGYRFIVDELSARGIAAGQNRVARLCSQQRIWSVFAKRRGPSRKAGPPVHDDLVDRQFNAAAPNLLWLTDFFSGRPALAVQAGRRRSSPETLTPCMSFGLHSSTTNSG
jgi:putative transposase